MMTHQRMPRAGGANARTGSPRARPIALCILITALTAAPLLAEPPATQTFDHTAPPDWPRLTAEDHAAAVAEYRANSDQAMLQAGVTLQAVETDYFLFYSDLKPAEAGEWAGLLDRMYDRLCDVFAIPRGQNIWRGKAVVYVFRNQPDHQKFELAIFNHPIDADTLGLCHTAPTGQVYITFYRQPHRKDFAHLLVHESVHGFVHRYRTPAYVPNWVNEGLAELIANELVPNSPMSYKAKKHAIKHMRRYKHLGGYFFDSPNITYWQYGIASGLTEFIIKHNRLGYVAFINALKYGQPWREALEEHVGVTPEKLVDAYGLSIKIRSLQP